MKKIGFFLVVLCWMMSASAAEMLLREDNIDSILAQMTVREKATLVVGNGWGSMFEGLHLPFAGKHRVAGAAGETRGIKRLGIPSLVLSDGPAGVRMKEKGAIAFPVGLSVAAAHDTLLAYEIGRAIGEEASAIGVDVMLGPGMNLTTNPMCGRNYEYFSDDVELSSETAAYMVRGIQSTGVGACVKHFAVNTQENGRFHHDAVVDSATLHDLYLENFRRAIALSQPWAVMSAYNKINGTHAQLNHWLLTDVLRDEWQYEGVVLTDWQAHPEDVEKIAAGNDLLMPGSRRNVRSVCRSVKRGELSEARLDEAARRVLEMVVRSHTFREDRPIGYDTVAHLALCRRAGAKGCVWMKESKERLRKDQRVALFGSTSYKLIVGGTGSGFVNFDKSVSLYEAMCAEGIVCDEPLAASYQSYMQKRRSYRKTEGMSIVSKYMGSPSLKEMPVTKEEIERSVSASDIAIVTIGRQAGEGKDREEAGDMYLSDQERTMLTMIRDVCHAQGKKLIVVLNTAGLIEVASWQDLTDGVLMAWCPGQQGGLSILDRLTD